MARKERKGKETQRNGVCRSWELGWVGLKGWGIVGDGLGGWVKVEVRRREERGSEVFCCGKGKGKGKQGG